MTKLSKALILYNLILLIVVAIMSMIILNSVLKSSKSISNIETSLSGIEFIEAQ